VPKIYWVGTGIAMHLAKAEDPSGARLENLVLHDLLAWRNARIECAELSYWRTSIGEELDFVIEAVGKPLPIDVKSTARPRLPIPRTCARSALSTARKRGPDCSCTPVTRLNGWRPMCWLHPGGRFCKDMQRGGEPAVSIDCQRARINSEGGYRSASIAVYRLQAEVFGGRSDGKFGAPSLELSIFQVLTSAGDN
jgi:Domain of unknown function (DUF4143)